MKPYNSDPHVPEWISALDGQLLSKAELDVLDFIWYCKKHGCRTSNDRIGSFTHWSHNTVERAIQKLYRLDLISIKNYALRTRRLYSVEWADREQWEKYRHLNEKQHPQGGKMFPKSETDPPQRGAHITKLDKTTPKESSSLVISEPPATGDVFLPSSAGGLCGSGGGGSSETSTPKPQPKKSRDLDQLKAERSGPPTTPKQKKPYDDDELNAQQLYEKCLKLNPDKQLAKDLTLFKFPNADLEE
jgi:DNA-binding MarR family transcriptional regulator